MRVLLALTTCLIAAPALAEGALTTFRCVTDNDETRIFAIAPDALDDAGAGPVSILDNGVEAQGYAASHLGPYAWEVDGILTTLLLDGAAQADLAMIVHRLDTNQQPPEAVQTKIICEAPT